MPAVGNRSRRNPCHPHALLTVPALLCAVWLAVVWPGAAAGQSRLADDTIRADAAYRFLEGRMDAEAGSGARFVQSYATADCALGGAPNAAYIYDQALVLLAFLARRGPGDLQRARTIADALVTVQNHDRTFADGRLRNAYAAGRPVDPRKGWARLPGIWNSEQRIYLEDEYALGSDTGNMAWAAIALVQAQRLLDTNKATPYVTAAVKLAEWIVANTAAADARGGFCGGFAGAEKAPGDPRGQTRLAWRSTEHNIDLVALFEHLSAFHGGDSEKGRFWSAQKAHALKFVASMQAGTGDDTFLWSGTVEDGVTTNRQVLPLDVQTWGVLALPEADAGGPYARVLSWALTHCRAGKIEHALDYNCNDGDGAWWEGTAQAAAALHFVKQDAQAEPLIAALKAAQVREGAFAGGLPAASICGLTTGFYKTWGPTGKTLPVRYSNAPHIGATAWFIFALRAENPFFLSPP
jgi:hypothetical protein